MRQLQLQTPNMRGTDVADWQRFLIAQGLSTNPADGIFGTATASATRAFQAKAGMGADGIVGTFTLARAVEQGLVSTTGPLIAGIDASVNCGPFAAAIAAAGIQFVARYYSKTASKATKAAEAIALDGAGLQLVTVYEDINNDVKFFTAAIGTQQGTTALAQAGAVGQPAGSAIYFAVDVDVLTGQVNGPVMEYFHAVHDALAGSPYAVGVYGSGLTCRIIRDAGFAKYTWLAGASGWQEYRAFLPQADIVQAAPARDLIPKKLNVDDDLAQSTDFGAFRLP
jgi:peptidoglycan hydrolase-like protein with peptidoglycan-binding domain